MLVLSRKKNEQIVIGKPGPDQVVVTIVEIRGDKVRLGMNANKDVPVHRREVYEAIQRNDVPGGQTFVAKPDPKHEAAVTPAADSVSAAQPQDNQ